LKYGGSLKRLRIAAFLIGNIHKKRVHHLLLDSFYSLLFVQYETMSYSTIFVAALWIPIKLFLSQELTNKTHTHQKAIINYQ